MIKRVLVFSNEIPPAGGGSGVIAKKLVENFVKLGAKVTLVSGNESDLSSDQVEHIRVFRSTVIWIFSYGYALLTKLNFSQYDCVILNDQMATYLSGLFLTRSQLTQCTVVVHGRDSNFFFNRSSNKHKFFCFGKFYKRAITHCKSIVAVSRWTQDEYLRHVPEDIRDSIQTKISWHYAGIDKADLMGANSHQISAASKLEGKRVLISVGRLVARKGYTEMLEILARNIEQYPDLAWVIIGKGPMREKLEQRSIELGIREHLIFVGKIPRTALNQYYLNADAFWLYSKIEPFGLVYLEAAMFDLPSLGPEAGGAREAIVPGVTGFYMDDDADLNSLLENCKALKRSGKPSTYANSLSTEKFSRYLLDEAS